MPLDWGKIIDAAHEDNERHGVTVQRGKKYSQVATRVERFRRSFGGWGIGTEIVQFSAKAGEPVVVKATVTDESGRVVATGHAFEIVGQGNVNKTAALENAETSAIGRALAVLGLHGGELASLNEIEGTGRKEQAQTRERNADLADAPPPVDAPKQHDAVTSVGMSLDGAQSEEALLAKIEEIFRTWGESGWPPAIIDKSKSACERLGLDMKKVGLKVRARIADKDSHKQGEAA